MATDYKFQGWMGLDSNSIKGNMVWQEYEPKEWAETDVDIQVTHSGICGSDLHTLRSGWGETDYPCVVGHEIVGKAVRVGKDVKNIKLGDRVGVGAQSDSCRECEECQAGNEQYCTVQNVNTYNSKHFNGGKAYGGHADYSRVPSHFVIKIPDGVPSEAAGPLMCGGVTIYSPLKEGGCGPGKKVGVVGIGGIGHFGLLFAKALGADKVVAISRSSSKKADAMKLGADEFIATAEDDKWDEHHANSLDLIISTVSAGDMPLSGYLSLLRPHGQFTQVGAPDDELPGFSAFALIAKNAKLGGSSIGSPEVIKEMLELVASKGIQPWVETRPMEDANQAIVDMEAGKARYRYTLVNKKHL
jgi:alcohol dehydrogenase (NADP+)